MVKHLEYFWNQGNIDEENEYIGKQLCGGDMEGTNLAICNIFYNKVYINLHMLCSLMLNRISEEMDGGDIVIVNHSRTLQRNLHFKQIVFVTM